MPIERRYLPHRDKDPALQADPVLLAHEHESRAMADRTRAIATVLLRR